MRGTVLAVAVGGACLVTGLSSVHAGGRPQSVKEFQAEQVVVIKARPVTPRPALSPAIVDRPIGNNVPVLNAPALNEPALNEPALNEPVVTAPLPDLPVRNVPIRNVPVRSAPAHPPVFTSRLDAVTTRASEMTTGSMVLPTPAAAPLVRPPARQLPEPVVANNEPTKRIVRQAIRQKRRQDSAARRRERAERSRDWMKSVLGQ